MWKNVLILSLILFFSIILLFRCNRSASCYVKDVPETISSKKSVLEKNADRQLVTIDVQGMTCSECENEVESALKKVPGVLKVQADAKNGVALIEYNPKIINEKEMVAVVNKTGYKASATISKTNN